MLPSIENFTGWKINHIGSIEIFSNVVNRENILPLLEYLIIEREAVCMADVVIHPPLYF